MFLNFSYDDFFSSGAPVDEFNVLLVESIESGSSIFLRLEEGKVCLELLPASQRQTAIELRGDLVVANLDLQELTAPVSILVPLLMRINGLVLPTSRIFSVPIYSRSIAEFFMRNLFYNAFHDGSLKIDVRENSRSTELQRYESELARRYLWVMRAFCDDPVLEMKGFLEKFIVNVHLQTMSFTNLLLETGSAEIRRQVTQLAPVQSSGEQAEQVRQILSVRKELSPHLV